MKKYALWFLLSALLLIGCGQTGPLYLPESETPETLKKDNEKPGKLLGSPEQPPQ